MSAISLPFLVSETNYILAVPIDDEQILFDVRWNSRDAGWYLDIYEADNTIVELNVKVVVGIKLANRSLHDFFKNHVIMAVDTTGQGLDPSFDDLGSRVQVLVQSINDMI